MLFKIKGNRDAFLLVALTIAFNVWEYLIPSRVTNYAGYVTGALTFIALIEVIQFIFKQYGIVFFIIVIAVLLAGFQYLPHILKLYPTKPYMYGVYIGVVAAILLRIINKLSKKMNTA